MTVLSPLCFYLKLFLLSCNCLLAIMVTAQKKWDGGGGDGQWSTAINWSDDIVPVSTDNVLLDNSILTGNYTVQLPVVAVMINRLTVTPQIPAFIQVILPSSNIVIPAFTVNGSGGVIINNNAVFINSSGGSPGTAIVIADSIYINNGGRFVHNSSNGHASYITKLSRVPGTENGTFEFDVPGAASYTISLAGRTYGNLELSPDAAGGTKSYLSNGSTNALIRGECRINAGVNYSLDFTGELAILGQLMNYGNFNIASGSNNNIVKIRGHLHCFGVITESAAGQPLLELNGSGNQDISVSGNINNSVTLKINNAAGATLTGPVSLPYKLELTGGKITTTSSFLLTLQPVCTLSADSTNSNSFINGPLRKLGLNNAANFLFPVGKGITQRWLALKNATGDFTVEFFKNSAYSLASVMGIGIDHVSRMEYWSVDAVGAATGKLELSFDNVNSGGVTDLATLRVAQLSGASWIDAGNTATTGSAGAAGSVVSTVLNVFGPVAKYYTLGSSVYSQNPLPIEWVKFIVNSSGDGLHFYWQIPADINPDYFEIENSEDGIKFLFFKKVPSNSFNRNYFITGKNHLPNSRYYRLKIIQRQGVFYYSRVVRLHPQIGVAPRLNHCQTISSTHILLSLSATKSGQLIFYIVNNLGQQVKKIPIQIRSGNQYISLPVYDLRAGYYQVFGLSSSFYTNPLIFIKP